MIAFLHQIKSSNCTLVFSNQLNSGSSVICLASLLRVIVILTLYYLVVLVLFWATLFIFMYLWINEHLKWKPQKIFVYFLKWKQQKSTSKDITRFTVIFRIASRPSAEKGCPPYLSLVLLYFVCRIYHFHFPYIVRGRMWKSLVSI